MISICLELSLFGRTLYGLQNNFKRKNTKIRVFFGWDYTDKTGNLGKGVLSLIATIIR